jgi:HKD family nuclease
MTPIIGVAMVTDTQPNQVELVLNELPDDHSDILGSLLRSAQTFLCMTAFAKETGLKLIRDQLKKRLNAGLAARFVIGLNFYQTDPSVLNELLALSKRHKLELLVSRPPWDFEQGTKDAPTEGDEVWNFHPKVFVFEYLRGSCALIGSANLTGGGLGDNHEASILVRAGSEVIADRIGRQIKLLIKDRQIVTATTAIVDEYARRHSIYKVHTKLAERRAKREFRRTGTLNLNTLRAILIEMKADTTEEGFQAQKTYRDKARLESRKVLAQISSKAVISKNSFLKLYEPLVTDLWHSGGLHRGKNLVAEHASIFQDALRSLANIKSLSVEQAFDVLHQEILKINGAGINIMTEILHSFDNLRFVVMNQNSVSGLALADVGGFPINPSKHIVDAAMYATFCKQALEVRRQLRLKTFTELDALLNYAYWPR